VAVSTELRIKVKDAQGYDKTLTFGIVTAAFGAAVTLPTAVVINALVASIFSDDAGGAPSDSIVVSYEVAVIEGAPAGTGNGGSGTNIAARVRSNLGTVNEWEVLIPGLNKARVQFGISDPNLIVTGAGSIFDAIRNAGDAAGLKITGNDGQVYIAKGDVMQEGVLFTGRRSPKKPH
jgi:hypothetical protein